MTLKDQFTAKLPELSARSRLYAVAVDALRRDVAKAKDAIVAAAKSDIALLLALVPDKWIEWEAHQFLSAVRADMQRGPMSEKDGVTCQRPDVDQGNYALAPSTSLPGEGQGGHVSQAIVAQSRQPQEGSSGQTLFGPLICDAALPSPELHGKGQLPADTRLQVAQSMQPVEGGGGLVKHDNLMIGAAPSSSNVNSGSQTPIGSHLGSAPAADTIPLPRREARAMSAIQGIMAKSIVFRLQDGRDIMDVQFHELKKIKHGAMKRATAFAREAVVADYLLKNCTYANPDPFERVGAYFPQKLLELAMAEANKKETAHV